eukprot:1872924-Heterocapsa_arctica.AAC.1
MDPDAPTATQMVSLDWSSVSQVRRSSRSAPCPCSQVGGLAERSLIQAARTASAVISRGMLGSPALWLSPGLPSPPSLSDAASSPEGCMTRR